MVLTEILIAVVVIVGGIALIVGLDWIATDAVWELEDWIKVTFEEGEKNS